MSAKPDTDCDCIDWPLSGGLMHAPGCPAQPADEATTDLTAVLAAHFPQVVGPSLLLCKCRTRTFLHEEWLAHLADALALVIRAERAACRHFELPDTLWRRLRVAEEQAARRLDLLRAVVSYDAANQSDLPLGLLDSIRAEAERRGES